MTLINCCRVAWRFDQKTLAFVGTFPSVLKLLNTDHYGVVIAGGRSAISYPAGGVNQDGSGSDDVNSSTSYVVRPRRGSSLIASTTIPRSFAIHVSWVMVRGNSFPSARAGMIRVSRIPWASSPANEVRPACEGLPCRHHIDGESHSHCGRIYIALPGSAAGRIANPGFPTDSNLRVCRCSDWALLVAPDRLERSTCGLGNRRSIHLSYGAISCGLVRD